MPDIVYCDNKDCCCYDDDRERRNVSENDLEQLKFENEKLRELARDLRFCARQSICLKCEHGRICDLRLDERCAELGIEVDE